MIDIRSKYETSVRALVAIADNMRRQGIGAEEIAKALHAERLAIASAFKQLTPEPMRTKIRERTIAAYGNPIGPSIGFLRAAGKSWEDIIEGASRPGTLPE